MADQNEGGSIGHRMVDTGWSDRVERGGDSLDDLVDAANIALRDWERVAANRTDPLQAGDRLHTALSRLLAAHNGCTMSGSGSLPFHSTQPSQSSRMQSAYG